mgnify:CR=1 FL=1
MIVQLWVEGTGDVPETGQLATVLYLDQLFIAIIIDKRHDARNG